LRRLCKAASKKLTLRKRDPQRTSLVRADETASREPPSSFPLRRGHIARGPLAKRFNSKGSVCAKDCVATSLGVLSPVVHYLAFPQTTGTALVQVAESSNPDEREITTTRRALHIWREQVKQPVTFRHPLPTFPSPLFLNNPVGAAAGPPNQRRSPRGSNAENPGPQYHAVPKLK
jgi:hypothetical protein